MSCCGCSGNRLQGRALQNLKSLVVGLENEWVDFVFWTEMGLRKKLKTRVYTTFLLIQPSLLNIFSKENMLPLCLYQTTHLISKHLIMRFPTVFFLTFGSAPGKKHEQWVAHFAKGHKYMYLSLEYIVHTWHRDCTVAGSSCRRVFNCQPHYCCHSRDAR